MSLLLHQSAKDLRQHGRVLLAWLGILSLRAAIVVFPIDVWYPGLAQSAIAGIYLALNIAALALGVVLVVLVVQDDPATGTTAFWVTRPIGRATMLASKLASVIAVCVIVPVLFDAMALALNQVPGADVARAMVQGSFERLALVLPTAALAVVTADLAGFALAGLCAIGGLLALVVLVSLLFGRGASMAAHASSLLVDAVVLMAGGLVVASMQYLRRSRRRSIATIVAALAVCAVLVRFWQVDLLGVERRPDLAHVAAGSGEVWVTGRVDVARPSPRGKAMTVSADVVASPPRETVLATPVGLEARLTLPSGPVGFKQLARRGNVALDASAGADTARAAAGAVGAVRLLQDRSSTAATRVRMPLMSLDERQLSEAETAGARYDGQVTLRATAFTRSTGVPLEPGAGGAAGDRRFRVLAAGCMAGSCEVLLRDVVAVFVYDNRVPSKVNYVLVNRQRRAALLPASSDLKVLGEPGYAFGHHLAITQRALRFAASEGEAAEVDAAWLKEAELVPVIATELGDFTRPIVIPDFGGVLRSGPPATSPGQEANR